MIKKTFFRSNCCGASLIENSEICAECKEHCESIICTETDKFFTDETGDLKCKKCNGYIIEEDYNFCPWCGD